MQAGFNDIPENCSYLKKQFFINNPTEKPESVIADELAAIRGNDDNYQRVEEEDENNQEQQVADEDEDKTLQQVDIKMLQV